MYGEDFLRDFFGMPKRQTTTTTQQAEPAPKHRKVSDDNPYLVALMSELLTTLHTSGVLTRTEVEAVVTRARARVAERG